VFRTKRSEKTHPRSEQREDRLGGMIPIKEIRMAGASNSQQKKSEKSVSMKGKKWLGRY